EEELQAETQAEVRAAAIERAEHGVVEALGGEARARVGERAYAGQHDAFRARDRGRVARHVDAHAGAFERLRDRAQVAGAVVDERDAGGGCRHGARASPSPTARR